jgi:thiol:disulfide interchange protein DsbD
MLLYAILGIGFAIYLGALEAGQHIFKKSVAVILFVYSLSLMIGVLAGSTSMAKPLEFLKPQAVTSIVKSEVKHTPFIKITSISELDALLQKHKGEKILLDFYADWCTSCKELEDVTFADQNVRVKMDEFILIKADVTANSEENKALTKKYGVFGPPALLFFNKEGKLLSGETIVGFIEPQPFLQHLNQL